MNLDKYTDRAKGLLQAAQHLAIGVAISSLRRNIFSRF